MTDVSKEYAEAVFALAVESGKGQTYADRMALTVSLCRENPAFIELLASPNIPKKERCDIIDRVFIGDEVMEDIGSLVKLLCERGHIREIFGIAEEFSALWEETNGIVTAEVTSAVVLTEEEKLSLQKKLEQKLHRRVSLDCRVDASILGGVIVKADGQIMDGSLKRKLRDMENLLGARS